MIRFRTMLAAAAAATCAACALADAAATPASTVRYATDAYPAFDGEENIIARGKKTPGFFAWWSGPKRDTPSAQLEWAEECEKAGALGRARRAYNALVAEWPASPEAPAAQAKLADMLAEKAFDWQDAFEEYRYLADFYPSHCDFDATVEKMYDMARAMREEGRRILFFRIANTVDVRRAFEAVVARAPGAPFAPKALFAVAELREEEEEFEKAISVWELLRNLHPRSPEARTALVREAKTRMKLLDEHGYNRARCQDTVAFLKMAIASGQAPEAKGEMEAWLESAQALVEDEAYRAARFYDSRTRTKRSAASAYERFLREYPASRHADAVRERLAELREEATK